MFLDELLVKSLKDESLAKIPVVGISRDSETAKSGNAYFCLTHDRQKAEERTLQALSNGACAVIGEYAFPFANCIAVKDVRDVFARSCANFYGRACDDLKIIGVTGTNGKTA